MRKSEIMLFILFLYMITDVHGLAISGQSMKIIIDHVPGYTREDTFYITNNEGYVSSYSITPTDEKGNLPGEYFTVTPNRIENVPSGETRQFNVKVSLPENISSVGDNEVYVQARIDTSASSVITAVPSVAIRYIIYVLYPFKYIHYEVSSPDMNVNETKDIFLSVTNLGKPVINMAKGTFEIYDSETNKLVRTLDSVPMFNIPSRDRRIALISFDSRGLNPGNYKTVATINWDDNRTVTERNFRIGTKNVKILSYPKLFEYNAINKMDISVESGWNTKIENMYAEIRIIDPDTGKKVKEFRSFAADLYPWETKTLESYFDTSGLAKKEYDAEIVLNYEGAMSSAADKIRIDENINAVVVKEIPGRFKLDFSQFSKNLTPVNFLILLLATFLFVNIFLIYSLIKGKKKKNILVDEAIVGKVIELISQYKDEYIKEMMIKKGWGEEEIRIILEEAKRRVKK